ncbi:conserved hypothetical protein [Syntrophobacter sp. SbD1]|nr:conserved hypothetical protein [Syntrophobacter sp. SbD1]
MLMFEINGSHVAELSDTDLRTLVARLCEAELRRAGLPRSAIIAGGNQDAPDGGLDVRVELPGSANVSGFIPRPVTGFQVKVPDMSPKAILAEMRPKGTIRPDIQDLAEVSGAYVIISSKGSTSFSALQRRRNAMSEAVADVENSENLELEFYDRDRLASWVRDHPGLVAWVRERIGKPIKGWRPFANWANSQKSVNAEYVVDTKSRVQDWRTKREGTIGVVQGLERIREVLAQPKGAVRLIGLSGMGKTRLVQALFDERIGAQSLAPALPVYCDLADEPEPSPRDMVRRLVQNRQRAIVVVDNCPPATHSALTKVCTEAESALSLITVEYDVGDDDPEGTEVFRLEQASDSVIEHLLERLSPQISQLNRRRIAELSEGNARVALALAHTVRRGDSIANLSDRELFERLFHQRRPQDEGLLKAAEICSLVYSFNGEAGEASEVPFLAKLAELSVSQLYRCVGELRARGLVQCRGPWRAVLPQALANTLAIWALDKMPPENTADFFRGTSERLLKSFSRRLGYLHDSESAQKIVRNWLSTGGCLSNLAQLNQLGRTMLEYVAPVVPEAVLETLERAAAGEDGKDFVAASSTSRGSTWISLLCSIAYDPALFTRATLLLVRFKTAEGDNKNKADSSFKNLFQLYLSGTHAPIGQRLEVIETLLASEDPAIQSCGLDAVDALLETYFSSSLRFDFGARPRDYGWYPSSSEEITTWYRGAIGIARRLALSGSTLNNNAKSMLASKFKDLWTRTGTQKELEAVARSIAEQGFWLEGWVEICKTINFGIEGMLQEDQARLRALEEFLRPNDLLQKARAYVLSKGHDTVGINDSEPGTESKRIIAGFERTNGVTEGLGYGLANNTEILAPLMPDLVRGKSGRHWYFGRGLATGADELSGMWRRLVDGFAATPENERNIQVLRGFLNSAVERDPKIIAQILDASIESKILGPWFPVLQTSVKIDERGAARLESAVKMGKAPSLTYQYLTFGRATDSIPTSTLRKLILGISLLPEGYDIAVDILAMRIHSVRDSGPPIDDEIIRCGRELVLDYSFGHSNQNVDYEIGEIVDACFRESAEEDARKLCRRLAGAFNEYKAYAYNYRDVLKSLFRWVPLVALDELLGEPGITRRQLNQYMDLNKDSLTEIVQIDTLLTWAQVDPVSRFPLLASTIVPFIGGDEKSEAVWKPIAYQLLESAPVRLKVLIAFGSHFLPKSWSGSLASMLENRRALPQAFLSDPDPQVAAWAREQDAWLARQAEAERLSVRQTDGSFE